MGLSISLCLSKLYHHGSMIENNSKSNCWSQLHKPYKNYTHSFYSIATLDFKLKLNIFLFSNT